MLPETTVPYYEFSYKFNVSTPAPGPTPPPTPTPVEPTINTKKSNVLPQIIEKTVPVVEKKEVEKLVYTNAENTVPIPIAIASCIGACVLGVLATLLIRRLSTKKH